ncbi:hypothetical protein ONS95_007564 [Cadophora gregata]|uniref:uncharacterized protein n=1 Tax=Cadophora gregata TaxID=51156 RepID=UPI0026DC6377|nr:uncharacterized protein ONS95_007564 [Cadophora gregata]KAK0118681.1 hypothetical protein ONS96_011768 [Cadophora gregata f. sp. sojae]KAK0125940.1 hypothetical protein ONS95_007564 [Cadophora gregata]
MEIFGLNIGLFTTFLILLVLYLILTTIYRLYLSPLSHFPGPPICAITRLSWLIALIRGHQSRFPLLLHSQYGAIVRIAPNELSFTSPQAWKDIYAHHQGRPEMAKNLQLYSQQPGSTHILIANREDHTRFRRTLSHAFSEASMREQEGILQLYAGGLVERLKTFAGSSCSSNYNSNSSSKDEDGDEHGDAKKDERIPSQHQSTSAPGTTTPPST